MSDSRIRLFSILALAMIFSVAFAPEGLAAQPDPPLTFCGYSLRLPGESEAGLQWRELQSEPELLVLESRSDAGGAQWLLSCNANTGRTSQVSEIRAHARLRGQTIHELKEREVDQLIPAVVFSRTRVFEGNRVKSVESYFATRDLEYRIFALPARGSREQVSPAAYAELDRLMNAMLDSLEFNGAVEATITEADYRWRLYALTGLGIALAIGAILLALRIVLSKRRPASNRNEK